MLTDAAAKKAAPADKPYKMFDTGGLFLLVSSASKLWRMKYKLNSKEKLLSFGPYPEISISDARRARDEARAELRAGRDPSLTRKLLRANARAEDRAFAVVAEKWHAENVERWTEVHAADVIKSLRSWVFPDLGDIDLREINSAMVLETLRKIEKRGAIETAKRVRQRIEAVFEFGIIGGIATENPAIVVKRALKPLVRGRQPALTSLDEVRGIIRATDAEIAHPVTKLALRFIALTAVRPNEVRGAVLSEMRLGGDEPAWLIPAERMKMRRPHIVPLSRQAVEVIEAIKPLTGRAAYIFPNHRWAHKPMSENAMGYLLNRAGYHGKHVPHGWRAAFSSIMNEHFRSDRAIIDLMLAHQPGSKRGDREDEQVSSSEDAYNRAQHLARRRELAQAWADMLMDGMPPAAELLNGKRR
nr:integrase arm-type DNA-binding domain-containing protein [uncultured Acidocella sp.]